MGNNVGAKTNNNLFIKSLLTITDCWDDGLSVPELFFRVREASVFFPDVEGRTK